MTCLNLLNLLCGAEKFASKSFSELMKVLVSKSDNDNNKMIDIEITY